uniref:TctD transcriptional regulator n=1 Tax=Vertebrata thuyoides TaxID=2006970 RepID=A0A1Z1MBK6_9FLOR|nr:hypothetical protein [Vertebrata thuyoides]ARW63205.1 hypothetical protein [Vertebrata thuyoides]
MKKILLVDDDKKLCGLLSSYLISCNFSVKFLHCIRDALVYIEQKKPDLIISDIMMQDLDGYDFIKLLNLNDYFSKIPVIFLTAKGMTSDRIKGYNLGCYAYLAKPFDPKELIAIINSILIHVDLLIKNSFSFSPYSNSSIYNPFFCNFKFTNREKSILNLVVQGYMNKEIAITLNTGQRNVEKYVTRLFHKTNVRNRIELIKLFTLFK